MINFYYFQDREKEKEREKEREKDRERKKNEKIKAFQFKHFIKKRHIFSKLLESNTYFYFDIYYTHTNLYRSTLKSG